MRAGIRVDVEGQHGAWVVSRELPELVCQHFEPLRICDEPLLRYATNEVSCDQARVVVKAREDAAEVLAKELAILIVEEMGRCDTYNGYRKVEGDTP